MPGITRPPGPANLPVIGHLPAFRKDPLGFLTRMSRDHGPISYFKLGNQHLYLLDEPGLVQDVLVNKSRNFHKSRVLQRSKILLGDGLLTSEGDFHLRQRRLVQPAFHRERLAAYANIMSDLTERASSRWRDGEEIDIHQAMMKLTLAIVARTLFSTDVDADAEAIGESMAAGIAFASVSDSRGPRARWCWRRSRDVGASR